jgi:hypothetical protein
VIWAPNLDKLKLKLKLSLIFFVVPGPKGYAEVLLGNTDYGVREKQYWVFFVATIVELRNQVRNRQIEKSAL